MKRGLNKENSLPDPEFGGESSESARAIHYVVQKDTLMTYVSARFAQADPGIVSGSTIERKKMSTKTIYKRIALVAVAALGMGVLTSVSPANAATNTKIFCAEADGLALASPSIPTATNDICNGVAGVANFVTLEWHGTPVVGSRLTISGAGATFSNASDTAKVSVPLNGSSATVISGNPTDDTIRVNTPTVGTVTVSYFGAPTGGVYGAAVETVVITVNAASVEGVVSAATSTGTLSVTGAASANAKLSADEKSITAPSTGGEKVGQIAISLQTVSTGALPATNKTSIAITGPGYLTVSGASGGTNATGLSFFETGSDKTFDVSIYGNGSTGTATITITSGAFSVTRTVTFYGVANKIVATQVLKRVSTAGAQLGDTTAETSTAVSLLVTDSSGNPVAGVTPTAVPGTASIIASGTCSASNAAGKSFCSVTSAASTSGKTGTVTFKTTVAAVDIISNAVTFTSGGALAKYSAAFGKAVYAPGEKMTLVLSGTDAAGNPSFDGATDILDGSAASTPFAVTTSSSVTNDWTAAATSIVFVDGKGSLEIFAPLSAGPFSVTLNTIAGLETAMGATTLTATTTVSDSASLSALTTLVNSLIAKINALNKLVIKIQKKVRA
jgi:trimeric autotransporter adhesin